jgi:glycosyltransferase involved in cell wall biosynthesis
VGIALARAAADRAIAYEHIYCDSENIGMPLAWLLAGHSPRPRLTMIAHYLTPLKKRLLCRVLRVHRAIDCVALHSPAQHRRAAQCGLSRTQIADVPYQVDSSFWSPGEGTAKHIASAGQEFRDYATLIEAVAPLSVPVEIAAGSFWSNRSINFTPETLPAHIHTARRPYVELRQLYDQSRFVVVPLHDVDFQAGIIAILEAMAMAKAVIVTRTRGQTGVVSGQLMTSGGLADIGEASWAQATGMYVPPGDAGALRMAITYLLDNPDIASAMGAAGRRHVEANFTIELFAERISRMIRGDMGAVSSSPAAR